MNSSWQFCKSAVLLISIIAFGGAVNAEEFQFISHKYMRQTTFVCNGQKFKLPIFPYMDKSFDSPESNAYLITTKKACSPEYFSVGIGLGKDCNGAHICEQGSFAFSKADGILKHDIQRIHYATTHTVALTQGLEGYFVSPTCGSYCGAAKLIWLRDGIIYEITSEWVSDDPKGIQELIESANSYIDSED
jgi:hypothetical protein